MLNVFAAAACSAVISLSASASLSDICQNLKEDDTFDTIFTRQSNSLACVSTRQKKLATVATQHWYGLEKTRNFETFAEYNELAEGLQCSRVSFAGETYDAVSVGFGGGNSAQYLFKEGILVAPLFVDKLDCYDDLSAQGN